MTDTNSQPPSTAPAEEVLSPARRRAEARKAKILAQGGDRLAKITGAMKAGSGVADDIYDSTPAAKPASVAPQPQPTLVDDDPAEIDISLPFTSTVNADGTTRRRLTKKTSKGPASFAPRFPVNGFGEAPSLADRMAGDDTPVGAGQQLSFPPEMESMDGNPFAEMMKMMGMPPGMDPGGQANPFAAMQGMMGGMGPDGQPVMPGAPPPPPSLIDRVFPLLHLLAVIGLAVTAVMWWEPSLRSFGSGNASVEPMGWAGLVGGGRNEWENVVGGSGTGVGGGLAVVPVFWMFVTVELGLQAGRLFFSRFAAPVAPGMLQSLLMMIPAPYSTFILTLMKYYSIFSALIDDLSVLVFAVGCVVMWGAWKGGQGGGGVEGFVSPE